MLDNSLSWFFIIFSSEFRQNKIDAFETIMFLAIAHCFGFYNPKQLADFLGIPHQTFYHSLKEFSLYYLKKMLIRFMVKQASEQLRPLLDKSDTTKSRAGVSITVDNSVIDRLGKMLRCTWSWYSGLCKKVVNGQDLLGIVLTFGGMAFPLHLLFCSKQGRANTDKPGLLIAMLKELKLIIPKFANFINFISCYGYWQMKIVNKNFFLIKPSLYFTHYLGEREF